MKQQISRNINDLLMDSVKDLQPIILALHQMILEAMPLQTEVHYGGKEPYIVYFLHSPKEVLFSILVCTDHVKLFVHNLNDEILSQIPSLTGKSMAMRHIRIQVWDDTVQTIATQAITIKIESLERIGG